MMSVQDESKLKKNLISTTGPMKRRSNLGFSLRTNSMTCTLSIEKTSLSKTEQSRSTKISPINMRLVLKIVTMLTRKSLSSRSRSRN